MTLEFLNGGSWRYKHQNHWFKFPLDALHLNLEIPSARLDSEYFVEVGIPMTQELKGVEEDNSEKQWVGLQGEGTYGIGQTF